MKAHKQNEKDEFDKIYGKKNEYNFKFGTFESWRVARFDLEILP